MKTKWICVLVLVFLAVLFMAACQNDNKENGNTSSPSQVNVDDQGEDGGSKKPGEGEEQLKPGDPEEPEEPTKPKEPEEEEPPLYPPLEPLSPEIESRIIADYKTLREGAVDDDYWFIDFYYGTYNGYVVVMMGPPPAAIGGFFPPYDVIGDIRFLLSDPRYIEVWHEDRFLDLEGPFNRGHFMNLSPAYNIYEFLTQDDIVRIAYYHEKRGRYGTWFWQ